MNAKKEQVFRPHQSFGLWSLGLGSLGRVGKPGTKIVKHPVRKSKAQRKARKKNR